MDKTVSFEEYFNKSDGLPFIYDGKEIRMSDRINLQTSLISLNLTFLNTDSKWKQGIVLQTKGTISINGQKLHNKVILWEHTAPKEVEILINSKDKILFVHNVWDTGDGVMNYGHNGGAMTIEEESRTRYYYCNDGFPDDDLNDLIFKIEFLSGASF